MVPWDPIPAADSGTNGTHHSWLGKLKRFYWEFYFDAERI